jgi:hypothetical protein
MRCGRCIFCRLRYSRNWAIRCSHEGSLHEENSFLTVTFAPEHLPRFGSLSVSDCQLFLKRYREYLFRHFNIKIRMAYCGEYGEETNRPHYHFLIFGHWFHDAWQSGMRNGLPIFRSPTLDGMRRGTRGWKLENRDLDIRAPLWPFGQSEIGTLTFDSAAYVARYILKKAHGAASEKYWVVDRSTGELLNENTKEFFKTSRRPGIGKGWIDKYMGSVYPLDRVVIEGKELPPPPFYDVQYGKFSVELLDDLKADRLVRFSRRDKSDEGWDRLKVKEAVKLAQMSSLPRRVE